MALALVTGASSGIGLALAEELAASKTDLVLTARNGAALEHICAELSTLHGIQATAISLDLSRADAPQALLNAVAERDLSPGILINNAGFGTHGNFVEQTLDSQMEMIRLNVLAVVELTGRLLPAMVERGKGYILNVASTAAFQPGPLMAVYYASKAFVLHFSEAIANELKGTGVSVTALCPGPTESAFQERAKMKDSRLVQGGLMDARTVARAGLDGMYAGEPVVIPGLRNRLLATSVRFTPRFLVTNVVRQLNANTKP